MRVSYAYFVARPSSLVPRRSSLVHRSGWWSRPRRPCALVQLQEKLMCRGVSQYGFVALRRQHRPEKGGTQWIPPMLYATIRALRSLPPGAPGLPYPLGQTLHCTHSCWCLKALNQGGPRAVPTIRRPTLV